jgi:putative transcriptional regulator
MGKFFEDIKQGLEEAVAFEKGKTTLRTRLVELPAPPTSYTASDIKRIRVSGHYSQGVFAKVLNVSVKTIQSWEAGQRIPSHAALRLLEIVDKGIYRPQIYRKNA